MGHPRVSETGAQASLEPTEAGLAVAVPRHMRVEATAGKAPCATLRFTARMLGEAHVGQRHRLLLHRGAKLSVFPSGNQRVRLAVQAPGVNGQSGRSQVGGV